MVWKKPEYFYEDICEKVRKVVTEEDCELNFKDDKLYWSENQQKESSDRKSYVG